MSHWGIALSIPAVAPMVWLESSFEYLRTLISNPLTLYLAPFHYLFHIFLSLFSFSYTNENAWFVTVLLYRYYRFLGHLFANYFLYAPAPIPVRPRVTARNVHVIIPTVEPTNAAFDTCIRSILSHHPRGLTIVTGGRELLDIAGTVATNLADVSPATTISVLASDVQNKRIQINTALTRLAEEPDEHKDTIIVCVDDHAWWSGDRFLEHLIAPFEDPNIGLVGTRKEVARMKGNSFFDSFMNLIGCLYLERHNFEITGQNALDGGVLVISARTCAIRASVVLTEDFMTNYVNEMFWFNRCGPLNSDDDNFMTRYILCLGWKIKFQNDAENATCTDIGISGASKLHGQLTRWARSQWRSNPKSLVTEGICWQHKFWWTSHAAYGAWFVNAPIWMDILMWYAWYNCTLSWFKWWVLLAIMILSKVIKLSGHFRRHPMDLLSWEYVLYWLFTYAHVYYKLVSLFTFTDTTWSGRKLKGEGNTGDGDDDDAPSPRFPGRFTPPASTKSSAQSNSTSSHSGPPSPPEGFTTPEPGSHPNRFTPSGAFASKNGRRHKSGMQSDQSGPRLSSRNGRNSFDSFRSRRSHSPLNVYIQPCFESIESSYDDLQPHTPPMVVSPHHTVRRKSWTVNVPISPWTPSKPRRSSRDKPLPDTELTLADFTGPPPPTEPTIFSPIKSASDFLKKAPLFRLPDVHAGEDAHGIPSPARPIPYLFFPEPSTTKSTPRRRGSLLRPKRPTPQDPVISKKVEAAMIQQQLDAIAGQARARDRNKSPYKGYNRNFVRGCDCQRIHGSATGLSVPGKQETCGRCQSPSPDVYQAIRWR